MRHVADGTLRRLADEPLAVADRDATHLEACARCRDRARRVAEDATLAHRLLAPAGAVGDPSAAWSAAREIDPPPAGAALPVRVRRHRRLARTSLGTGASIAALCTVLAGVAAAATLTTVFAPRQVAPVTVSTADMRSLASFVGAGEGAALGGFDLPSGSTRLAFGTLSWRSEGGGGEVRSLAAAEAATKLSTSLPSVLPQGVGRGARVHVLPSLRAVVIFSPSAGPGLAGSSLVITLGPGIVARYPSGGARVGSPLVILAMAGPHATSTGADTGQLVDFLLSRPGVPTDLARELRLMGDLRDTLPVPAPAGMVASRTEIGGARAIVLRDRSNAASAVIWESRDRVVHAVAGLLDGKDLLGVAHQIR